MQKTEARAFSFCTFSSNAPWVSKIRLFDDFFSNFSIGGGRKSISQRKKSMRETVTRMTKMLRGGNGGDGIADTDDMGKPIDPR